MFVWALCSALYTLVAVIAVNTVWPRIKKRKVYVLNHVTWILAPNGKRNSICKVALCVFVCGNFSRGRFWQIIGLGLMIEVIFFFSLKIFLDFTLTCLNQTASSTSGSYNVSAKRFMFCFSEPHWTKQSWINATTDMPHFKVRATDILCNWCNAWNCTIVEPSPSPLSSLAYESHSVCSVHSQRQM